MRKLNREFEQRESPRLPVNLALRMSDFVHPREVVADQELNPMEKRAILAAWASDVSAVKGRPQFRWLSGTPGPVLLTQILAALRTLDAETEKESARIWALMAGAHGQGANS